MKVYNEDDYNRAMKEINELLAIGLHRLTPNEEVRLDDLYSSVEHYEYCMKFNKWEQ